MTTLHNMQAHSNPSLPERPRIDMDPGIAAKLATLGYVSRSRISRPAADANSGPVNALDRTNTGGQP
jgi:hypothetical protein